MVLLHGGTPRGAERIAACWADSRKVTQIVFKPDWDRDGKAAPFKRNDALLAEVPQAVIVFCQQRTGFARECPDCCGYG